MLVSRDHDDQYIVAALAYGTDAMLNRYSVVMVGVFPEDPNVIRGGVQASVYGLAKSLSEVADIDRIVVISPPIDAQAPCKKCEIDGIEVRFLDAPFKFISSSVFRIGYILGEVKSFEGFVVHVHGTGVLQALLCVVCRVKKIPLVWTIHGITEKETREIFKRRKTIGNFVRYILYTAFERTCLSVVRNIIVDTPYVRKEIKRSDGVDVIPQGVFSNELEPARRQKRNPNLVISVGALGPRKGHLLTLEAFSKVKQSVHGAELIIAGVENDRAYLDSLVQRIAELGLGASVTIKINANRSEVVEMFGSARVFALHSQEESQGIVLCEAMMTGLPIVATRVGGIPDIVNDQQSGILVDYGDVDRFAAGIVRLLSDDLLHAQMSQEGERCGGRYSWSRVAAEVAQVYCRALRQV